LIKVDDQHIYIDPSTKYTGLKNEDFGPADLILVTHGHEDHFDKKLIKKIRKLGSPIIAPPNLKKELGGDVVKIDGKKIYHAGDTDLIPEMEDWWDFDVALLPCGDTYTMDIEEASEAAIKMNPKIAIPMHIKDADLNVFKEKVEGGSSTRVVILAEGEEYALE
jgi:L-ascorbate metabolism protein UlaG (beta-lactamase superfamily)